MKTQEILQQPDKPEKEPGVFKKLRNKASARWYSTKLMSWLAETYPYKFTIGMKNDSFFWSRINGAFNGATLIGVAGVFGAAWGGLHFLPKVFQLLSFVHVAPIAALPLLPHIAVLAGCAALVGVGACALGYGIPKAWKSIEELCARTFPRFNPLRKFRLRTRKIVKGISAIPPVQKLGNGAGKVANKVVQRPLAQKLVKSRLGRVMRGPTQNQQDGFLSMVTIGGSLAWGIGLPAAIAIHVAALPAIATVGGLAALAVAVGIAAWEIYDCTVSITSSIKTLRHISRAHKNAATSSAEPVVTASPAQAAGDGPVVAANTAPAFNQAAGVEGTAAEPPAAAPVRSRRPGLGRSL